MNILLAFLVSIPFCIFVNFPPLTDLPKQLLALVVVFFLGFLVVFRSKRQINFSRAVALFAMICFWFLFTSFVGYGSVGPSFWGGVVVSIFGGLCLLISPSAKFLWGEQAVERFFMAVLLFAAGFVTIFGLLRFYGVAQVIIPWLEVSDSRLVGPWGQPNLSGLTILLGQISLVALFAAFRRSFLPVFLVVSSLFIYSGIMTGSRAWVVLFFAYLALLLLSGVKSSGAESAAARSFNRRAAAMLLAMFCVIYPASGVIDRWISEPLNDSSILDRSDASSALSRHTDFSGRARFGEWEKVRYYNELADNIWLGYGLGRYGYFSSQVALLDSDLQNNRKYWDNAHNFLIMALVEGGWIGFFLVILVFIWGVYFILKKVFSGVGEYYCYMLLVLLAQNLIEFSFWYLPFLFLFLFSLGSITKSRVLEFSHVIIPRSLYVLFFAVFIVSSGIAVKDWSTITNYYYQSYYGSEDVQRDDLSLDMVKTNIFLGYSAWETDILVNLPPSSGWGRELKVVDKLWRWQPIQAFSLRRATLLSATGSEDACEALTTTTALYPDTFPKIKEELEFFYELSGVDYPVSKYVSCALRGMNRWIK